MSKLIISAGGHVYDRMSGTWSEPNERLAKIGKAGEVAGGRVIHGTNGIVGVEVKRPTQPRPSGPAAGIVNPGQGGAGPAAPRASNGVPGKGGAGGAGPGSPAVVTAPQGGSLTVQVAPPDPEAVLPKDGPLKRIGIGAGQESLGAISDIGWVRSNTGWSSVPSSDIKERIEDNIFMESDWFWRNKVAPGLMLVPQPIPEFIQNPEALDFDFMSSEWRLKPGHVAIGGGF